MLPSHIRDAIDTYIPALGDWLDLDRAYQMAELIIDTKPEVVVEIGTFKGQSLITQAFAVRDNHKGKIYAIDPWSVSFAVEGSNDPENNDWWSKKINLEDIHHNCMKAIWDHHLEEWAIVIRSPSQFVFQLFPNNIDICYIDGNHSELVSCRDVRNYLPRIKSGGYIWADDTSWPTTQRALAIIEGQCDLVRSGGNFRLYRKR
jgi:Methyltransferase domain